MSTQLLSIGHDAKTVKGEKQGFLTGILYLAPSDMAGQGINTCANASAGCRAACLFTAGRAKMFPMINQARIRKTRALFADRAAFVAQLVKDIEALIRKAKRESLTPCVRLNGTSDLPWLSIELAQRFPEIQFYDYTKHPNAWQRTLPNYHITFSNSETNLLDCFAALEHGLNVAAVFPVSKKQSLPETWHGYKVINGDISDLRFGDEKGVVVGLKAKGLAKKDVSGFVQIAAIA